MKILLLAYACRPNFGSEPKNGWQWATRLAQWHDVVVLTHPRGREAIEREMAARPNPHLRFEFVELPSLLDPWKTASTETLVRFRYSLWQLAAYLTAKRLHRVQQFDLVHHITWASFSAPTLAWAMGIPFVLGPVGGGQTAPLHLRRYLGAKATAKEAIRNLRVSCTPFNPLARLVIRNTAAVLVSNYETEHIVRRLGARNTHLLIDAAVDPAWMPAEFPKREDRNHQVVLWMGRLESHKALNLAIDAFAQAEHSKRAELWILGDGPLRTACEELARRRGISERTRFLGWIPHSEVPKYLLQSDIFLFTSLRDTCPQPVLEAMAWGLPVVSLDHQGLRLHTDRAVMKASIASEMTVVADIARALDLLLASRELRSSMGREAWNWIRAGHLWPSRVEFVHRTVYPSACRTGAEGRADAATTKVGL